jgi:large subunit ribosomal protein L23
MKSIIKKALISERSFQNAGKGKFTFVVSKDSSKDEIRSDCEKMFGVSIEKINTTNIKGKIKFTKRKKGKKSDYKKAIITLKEGQTIDLFETENDKKNVKEKKIKASKDKMIVDNKDVEINIKSK